MMKIKVKAKQGEMVKLTILNTEEREEFTPPTRNQMKTLKKCVNERVSE